MEILVVDDCTPDNSMEVVYRIAKNHSRGSIIKCLAHNRNLGLSAARNTGIRNSTGEYVYFLDSDDYLAHVISVVHNTPTWIYDYLLALTVRLRNDTIIERFKSVARYLKVPGIKRDYLNRLKDCYRDCFNYTDFLCLLSLKFIPDLERVYKGELSKIIAIGNPNTYTTKEEIALTSKKKQLLYVGRVEWYQKRADRLVYIWKHLYQKFPDWELVIVGDGPIREDMERKFSQIERVRFTGYQDPDLYYRDAGILCLTSDFEGWPMWHYNGSLLN